MQFVSFLLVRTLRVEMWLVTSVMLLFCFAEADSPSRQKSGRQQPIFRAQVGLSIPNIVVMPALDEIQQALNKAVEYVVSVSKGIGQWSKERISKVVMFLTMALLSYKMLVIRYTVSVISVAAHTLASIPLIDSLPSITSPLSHITITTSVSSTSTETVITSISNITAPVIAAHLHRNFFGLTEEDERKAHGSSTAGQQRERYNRGRRDSAPQSNWSASQSNASVIKQHSPSELVLTLCLFSDGSASDVSACNHQAVPVQMKNYYKSVSENKEIIKLVTVLSTCINSSKKVGVMLQETNQRWCCAVTWPQSKRICC